MLLLDNDRIPGWSEQKTRPSHLYPAFVTRISGLEPSESAGDGPDLAGAAHGDTLQYFHKCLTNSFRRQWNILESIGDKDSLNNKIIVVLFTIKLTVHSAPLSPSLSCPTGKSAPDFSPSTVLSSLRVCSQSCNKWPGSRSRSTL